MSSHRVALYWLRRDLRLKDNTALLDACEHAQQVVFAFIHSPDEETPWQPGGASSWWLHRSLESLATQLEQREQKLILRVGPSLNVLRDLIRESGATLVVWNRLYDPAIVARDRKIKTSLQESGLEVRTHNANLFVEPWEIQTGDRKPYRVFTPFWRSAGQFLNTQPAPRTAPRKLPAAPVIRSSSPDDLRLLSRNSWHEKLSRYWMPGEQGAQKSLQRFVEVASAEYGVARDFPGQNGTSRLSPHLHFGEIGPRQILAALRAHERAAHEVFLRELGWREFAHHVLYHFPRTTDEPFNPKFADFKWERNAAALEAWRRGRTGFPIVDAGMRELWETGYMHNRVRMLVASLLTKNLRIHWRDGARWFWDTLVDADLANNSLGWQWTAGCGVDAAPYFRIFNPSLQSARFDPEGIYLRRWLPELALLSNKAIHAPHLASKDELRAATVELGRSYPHPIVDFKQTRASALEKYRSR